MPKFSLCGYNLKGCTVDQVITIMRGSGADGLEGAPPLFARQTIPDRLSTKKKLADAGTPMTSFHLPFGKEHDMAAFYRSEREAAVAAIREWLETAADFGAGTAILHPTTKGYDLKDNPESARFLANLIAGIRELIPTAEQRGIAIAVENMLPGESENYFSAVEHIAEFADAVDHPLVGFCYDTGHGFISAAGTGSLAILKAMGDRVKAFHLADNEGARDLHIAPGRGNIEWTALAEYIAALPFEKPMCIETSPFAPGPPYAGEAWKKLVDDTRRLFAPTER